MKCSSLTFWAVLMALLLVVAVPASAKPGAELMGTYWRAVEIDGKPVTPQPPKREAHLVLTAEGKRASGSTGCNRFTGTFQQTADAFHFSKMASTRMACPPPLDAQERAFLQSLNATTAVGISGNTLELKDAEGRVRLRFEARPSK